MGLRKRSFAIKCVVLLSLIQTSCAFHKGLLDFFFSGHRTTEGYDQVDTDRHGSSLSKPHLGPGIQVADDMILDLSKPNNKVAITVFHEVTRTVTVNPICVTMRKETPACFDNDVVSDNIHVRTPKNDREDPVDMYVKPSKQAEFNPIQNTEDSKRSGKSFHFHRPTPVLSKEEIRSSEQKQSNELAKLLSHGIVKVTKTIWSTNVKTILDAAVTATLVLENCVPYNLQLPKCKGKPLNTIVHQEATDVQEIDIRIKGT